jgi:hypothetical protein
VPPAAGEALLIYVAATTQVVSAAIVVERREDGACIARPEASLLHQRGTVRDQDPLPTNLEAAVRGDPDATVVAALLRVSSGNCGVILPPGGDHPEPRGLG